MMVERKVRKAARGVRVLLVLLMFAMLVGPKSLEADDTDDPARAPNIIVGGSVGYAHHFGKVLEVDGVTGASTQIEERNFADPGVAIGAFSDFGFFNAGPGDLGITLNFLASFPTVYLEVGLVLRYRMHFEVEANALRAVDPYIGFGSWFAFREDQMHDFYFIIGPTIGVDFEVGPPGLYVGFDLNINVVDPIPVRTTETVEGHPVDLEWRMDDVVGSFHIGYRLY